MTRVWYTTWGPSAGPCRHRHYSIELAKRCLRAHAKFRQRMRLAASDRELRVVIDPRGHQHFNHLKGPGAPL